MQSWALTFLLGFQIEDLDFYTPSLFAEQAVSQFTALKWWEAMEIMQEKPDESRIWGHL